ncbi:hypothetical protein BLOT_005970 [Blomia tropicalis]|nr:hypothetical protein BLOT_005970 [Blomia tropicalis]
MYASDKREKKKKGRGKNKFWLPFVQTRKRAAMSTPTCLLWNLLFKFGVGHRSTADHVQTQWLAPSSIHFLQIQDNDQHIRGHLTSSRNKVIGQSDNTLNNNNNNNNNNNTVNGQCMKKNGDHHQPQQHNNGCPISTVPFCLPKKLQVTEKDGSFIALDNNSLKLMRQLERLGHCTEVEVEIVPLSKVPPNIVQEIVIKNNRQNHNRKTRFRCRTAISTNDQKEYESPVCRHRRTQHRSCCAVSSGDTEIMNKDCLRSRSSIGCECNVNSNNEDTNVSSDVNTNTSNSCNSFSLNGHGTYLSDQQLRTARMSSTMTVMAPCLRQPITTSTPSSGHSMRQYKWTHCCNEQDHQQLNRTNE